MMEAAGLALILNAAIDAYSAKLHRDEIVAKAQKLADAGATPEQIADAILNMRKAALADAQKAIDEAKS